MKTIGLLCGLSWVSTQIYYQKINAQISGALKGMNSAKLIMNSVNAQNVVTLLNNERLDCLESFLIEECQKLERSGCDVIAITCNTIHYFYKAIQNALNIPIIHIMESVSRRLPEKNIKKAGIFCTEFTAKNRLYDSHLHGLGIDTLYPEQDEIKLIDEAIFKVCSSQLLSQDEINAVHKICDRIIEQGADAIILGCTELGYILENREDILILNSAEIHAEDLAMYALDFDKSENTKSPAVSFQYAHLPKELVYV